MLYLVVKALVSGVIVVIVSEVARRNPNVGGLIASLPLVSLLAFVWLWNDTRDVERIAAQSQSTFWFILPTLPMFLVFPALLRSGTAFWPALGIASGLTIALYATMVWLLPKVGINL